MVTKIANFYVLLLVMINT